MLVLEFKGNFSINVICCFYIDYFPKFLKFNLLRVTKLDKTTKNLKKSLNYVDDFLNTK